MYGFINRYLASVYLDYSSLKPESSLIRKLEDSISDPRYIYMSTAELPLPGAAPIHRIGFSAIDAGLNLTLLGNRFNFTLRSSTPEGKNIIELADFAKQAGNIFSAVLKCLDRKVQRIALVREGLLPEIDDKKIERIRSRLLNVPASVSDNNPFEWTYLFATKIEREFGGCKELTNTLIKAMRADFKLEGPGGGKEEYNSIRVDLDINTVPENTSERFGAKEIKAFFYKAIKWQAKLEKDFMDFIKEGGNAD